MTVKELYIAAGGDYEEVASRLMNDVIIKKFLLKFPNDASFANLGQSIENNDAEKAFMAAHTLKGVTASLGLGDLNRATSEITELLRGASVADTQEVKESFVCVEEKYNKALELINGID